ncbi:hypothetical protein ACTXT7_010083 [Hymenolepis weldensis]
MDAEDDHFLRSKGRFTGSYASVHFLSSSARSPLYLSVSLTRILVLSTPGVLPRDCS